jgi:hypothetical protein
MASCRGGSYASPEPDGLGLHALWLMVRSLATVSLGWVIHRCGVPEAILWKKEWGRGQHKMLLAINPIARSCARSNQATSRNESPGQRTGRTWLSTACCLQVTIPIVTPPPMPVIAYPPTRIAAKSLSALSYSVKDEVSATVLGSNRSVPRKHCNRSFQVRAQEGALAPAGASA